MPLHCNKENKAGLFEVSCKTFLFLLVLSLAFLSGSQASTIPVGLTFSTANYTQCDTLLIQIQVSTDKAFSNIVDQSNWTVCQSNTNFTYSAYLPPVQGNFYWHGRHMNRCTGEVSAWSVPFRFYLLLDPSKLVPGDVNGDGKCTVGDLIYLINYLWKSGPPPCRPYFKLLSLQQAK